MKGVAPVLAWLQPVFSDKERNWFAEAQVPELPPAQSWARIGLLVLVVGVGGFYLWAATLKLSSGAYAMGQVRLSDETQKVSHVEGGIIRELTVAEGQRVEAGQALVVLDDYSSGTNLAILAKQHDEYLARQARLEAVRDGAVSLTLPQDLLDRAAQADVLDILNAQQKQFQSDRASLESRKDILMQRIAQQEAIIAALNEQTAAGEKQLDLIREEAADVETLVTKGLERKSRLLALKRNQAALESQKADYQGRIAEAEKGISENRMQIVNLETDEKSKAVAELVDVQTRLAETEEKLVNARLRSKELTLRANFSGTVLNLAYRTVGAVVPPGQAILEVVPDSKVYVVDVKINPADIDVVQTGLPAEIRLSGLKQRTHLTIRGTVVRVSGDSLFDQRSGQAYFEARVAFDEGDLAQALQAHTADAPKTLRDELYPGMPADVTVVAHPRTMLEYLVQPVKDSFTRAFHES